eukprot:13873269-Heterocapsa_arctica.AAC.1
MIDGNAWTRYLGKDWKRTDTGFAVRVLERYIASMLELAGLMHAKGVNTPALTSHAMPLEEGEKELDEACHR